MYPFKGHFPKGEKDSSAFVLESGWMENKIIAINIIKITKIGKQQQVVHIKVNKT